MSFDFFYNFCVEGTENTINDPTFDQVGFERFLYREYINYKSYDSVDRTIKVLIYMAQDKWDEISSRHHMKSKRNLPEWF